MPSTVHAMRQTPRRAWRLLRAVAYEASEENLTFMAGSLAYHAFVSMLPLLLLVLGVVSTVGDSSIEAGYIALTRAILTPGAGDLLVAELRRASASRGVSVIGIAFLLWGTLRIFWGLDTAFSVIYGSEAENTISDHLADGLLVLVTIALAILVAAVVEAEIALRAVGPLGWATHRLGLIVGLSVVLLPMYYVFPDRDDMRVREIVPGVVTVSVGLTALESLVSLYVAVGGHSPTRNIVVAFLVFLTWLYLSGFVVLLGAVVNVVLADRSRRVDVRPFVGELLPDASESAPDRGEFRSAIDRLDQHPELAEEVVFRFDGSEASLPPPGVISVHRGESLLIPGDGPIRVELCWSSEQAV